jgi:hypothetical protein
MYTNSVPFWQVLGNPALWSNTVDPAVIEGFNAGVTKNQVALVGTGLTAATSGLLLGGVAGYEAGAGLYSTAFVNFGRVAQWFTEASLAEQSITVGGAGVTGAGAIEGVGAWPANRAFFNMNTKSVPAWGHTFIDHGQGRKVGEILANTARSTGIPQGQWLNDEEAAKYLASELPYIQGTASIPLPPGLGRVHLPNGSVIPAFRATLKPSPTRIRTGFPTKGGPYD